MTDILNPNVTVTVTVSGAPIESQEFGEVLYLAQPGSLGVGFTESVRRYTTPAEVATDLASTDITASVAAALTAAFAQRKRTGTLAVGQIPTGNLQVVDVFFGAAEATTTSQVYSITVDGEVFTHVALGAGEDTDDVAVALTALIQASSIPIDAFDYTAGGTELTSDNGTDPIEITAINGAATSTVTITTTATAPVGPPLDTLLAADDAWYMIATEVKSRGFQLEVAAWCETNKKPYMIQSADPQLLVGPDVLNQPVSEAIKILDYDYSSANYHPLDTEEFAYLWAVRKLATSPDTLSVDWAYADLIGLTTPLQSSASKAILDTANAGYFAGFRGSNVAFRGETGSGLTLENRVTIDWLEARIAEDVSAALLNASANDRKLPYSDPGFNNVRGIVQARLETGLSTSHLLVELDPLSGERTSPTATVPRRSAVSAGDESAKNVPVTFNATTANSIQQVSVTGYLSLTI